MSVGDIVCLSGELSPRPRSVRNWAMARSPFAASGGVLLRAPCAVRARGDFALLNIIARLIGTVPPAPSVLPSHSANRHRPFIFITLRTLCNCVKRARACFQSLAHTWTSACKSQVPYFQSLPHTWTKTPGVGGTLKVKFEIRNQSMYGFTDTQRCNLQERLRLSGSEDTQKRIDKKNG